jgi:hypothetical protein
MNLEKLSKKLGRNCFLKLKTDFCKKLFKSITKKYPPYDEDLARYLGIKIYKNRKLNENIQRWFLTGVVPLLIIRKILHKSSLSWKDVEKNLEGMKLRGGINEIYVKPVFPILLNEDLACIVGHILGDGSIDKRLSQPFYSNKDKKLLNEFQLSMKNIFGVKPRIWIQRGNNFKKRSKWIKRVNSIEEIPTGLQGGLFYPKIIGLLLYGIFGQFAKGSSKQVPKIVFGLSKEFKARLIRAFYDDESTVCTESRHIRVFQDNKKVLKDIQKLLIEFDIPTSKIKWYIKGKKRRYYFDINGYFIFLKFKKEIGFSSRNKSNDLNKLIRKLESSKTLRLRRGETKSIILESLKENQLTCKQIREILKSKYASLTWNEEVVRHHLKDLEKERKIFKELIGRTYVWHL